MRFSPPVKKLAGVILHRPPFFWFAWVRSAGRPGGGGGGGPGPESIYGLVCRVPGVFGEKSLKTKSSCKVLCRARLGQGGRHSESRCFIHMTAFGDWDRLICGEPIALQSLCGYSC